MAKKQRAYFGIDSYLINLILAIIPITGWLFGIITRLQRGKTVLALVQLIAGILSFGIVALIFWIIDIYSMAVHKDLKILA